MSKFVEHIRVVTTEAFGEDGTLLYSEKSTYKKAVEFNREFAEGVAAKHFSKNVKNLTVKGGMQGFLVSQK